jgi:hypothetical protein
MQRLGLGLALVLASTTVASAGTYVGLGIGSETSGSATRSDGIDAGGMDGFGRSGRLMVGTRISKLSVEGQLSRFDLEFGAQPYQSTQAAAALKLSIPLGNNFEVFGRGGLQRTWLSPQGSGYAAAGSGLLLGLGLEYRLNLALTAASVFVDYQHTSSSFTDDAMTQFDGSTGMYTLGATVSL